MIDIDRKKNELNIDANTNHEINTEWLTYHCRKRRIRQEIIDIIPILTEGLNTVFPHENQWEFQVQFYYSAVSMSFKVRLNCVIKFDRLTIKNSKNEKTIIQDLYVKIPIRFVAGTIVIESIQGTRGKIDYAEHMSKYFHSHLTSFYNSNTQEFTNFCIGSDGMKEATLMLNAEFSLNLFKLFLYQINEFVRWESLEGGPHIKMASIFNSYSTAIVKLSDEQSWMLYDVVNLYIHTDDFDITIVDNNLTITDVTDKLTKKLLNLLPDVFFVQRTISDKECSLNGMEKDCKTIKTRLIWNKKELKEIEVTPVIYKSDINKYLHTDIKNLIINYLQNKLHKKIIHVESY